MEIAKLRSIDGGGGLQYHHDNTLPAYVASFTTALQEIVKGYPVVQDMIQARLQGIPWDGDVPIPRNLNEYYESIEALAQQGACIDSKGLERVSLQNLWELSQQPKYLRGLQGRLCAHVHELRLQKLRRELSVLQPYNFCHVKVLTSGAGSEAAGFLNIVPKEGFQIKNSAEFAQAVRRRFQVKEPEWYQHQKCKCGVPLDPHGWHLQKCHKFTKGRVETHEQLKNIQSHMLSLAKVNHTLECIPFKDRREDGVENKKRLDIVINNPRILIPDIRKQKILVDVTVVNATIDTRDWIGEVGRNHMETATKESKAANEREADKHRHYDNDANDYNMEVCPMAFEVQGRWGSNSIKAFNYIISRMNDINNNNSLPKSLSTSYWKNKIALTLQTYVSKHVLSALHSLPFKHNIEPFQLMADG